MLAELLFCDLETVSTRIEKLEKALTKPTKTHEQEKRERRSDKPPGGGGPPIDWSEAPPGVVQPDEPAPGPAPAGTENQKA